MRKVIIVIGVSKPVKYVVPLLLLVLLISPKPARAQEIDEEYRFVRDYSFSGDYYIELNTAPSDSLLFFSVNLNKVIPQLKVLKARQVVDAHVLDNANLRGSRQLTAYDFDGDGIKEIVMSIYKPGKVKTRLYDYNAIDKPFRSLHGLPLDKEEFAGGTFSTLGDLNGDTIPELITVTVISFPLPGASRSITVYDVANDSLLWRYYTADFISSISYADSKDPRILYSTSGYDNGLVLNNGRYDLTDDDRGAWPMPPDGIEPEKLRLDNASSDTTSLIAALDAEGSLQWKHVTGGRYSHTYLTEEDSGDSLLFGTYFRQAQSQETGNWAYIDITDGKVLSKQHFPNKIESIRTNDGILTATDYEGIVYLVSSNGVLKSFTYPRELVANIQEVTIENETKKLLIDQTASITYLLDDEFERIAFSDGVYYKQLPLSGVLCLAYIGADLEFHYYRVEEIPWFEQIDAESWLVITVTISITTILLLVLWIMTMVKSVRRIRYINQELETATVELINAEKYAALGLTSSTVAHELNTPIGVILNSAQRLSEGTQSEKAAAFNTGLILKAANRSKTIIDKLLRTSKQQVEGGSCDLRQVVSDWMELYAESYRKQGVEIETSITSSASAALDAASAFQALNNLMSNARDALSQTEGEIKISIAIESGGDDVSLTVTDTGPGFPSAVLKDPFRPFHTTKEIGKGSGIGLWLTHKIVEQAEGSITIGNNDHGAYAVVKLPAAKSSKQEHMN